MGTVVLGKIVHIRLEAGLVILPLELVTGQKRFIKDLDFQVCMVVYTVVVYIAVQTHNTCLFTFVLFL